MATKISKESRLIILLAVIVPMLLTLGGVGVILYFEQGMLVCPDVRGTYNE